MKNQIEYTNVSKFLRPVSNKKLILMVDFKFKPNTGLPKIYNLNDLTDPHMYSELNSKTASEIGVVGMWLLWRLIEVYNNLKICGLMFGENFIEIHLWSDIQTPNDDDLESICKAINETINCYHYPAS
ncbi:MAG: hypothetical protein WCP93_02745 [Candidatus Berkelbacteria bacterium]